MTLHEILGVLPALGTGVVLGAIFYGGLWLTVRRGLGSTKPALWFLGSLLVRIAIVLAGFAFISGGRWERLLACLLGFTGARFAVTRIIGPPVERREVGAKGGGHAAQS
ncbi:MAG: ATP synthase subunit I [Planctomycetes bacterium]|nr:ATP synthase subunit I [Planctomycetota bacterium]